MLIFQGVAFFLQTAFASTFSADFFLQIEAAWSNEGGQQQVAEARSEELFRSEGGPDFSGGLCHGPP